MLDTTFTMSAAYVVQIVAVLFFVLFVVVVSKKRAWRQRIWKPLGLSALMGTLFCICAVFVYGDYEEAKEMIFKAAMTPDSVHLLRQYIGSGINVDIRDYQ